MQLLHSISDSPAGRGGCVSIGNFDGVHRGHQTILSRLVSLARQHGGPAVVVTFEPHPATVLKPGFAPPVLTRFERKAELLAEYGVDVLIALPPSPELFQLTPQEFFESLLVKQLQVQGIVEGPNFFFGRQRTGDVNTLRTLGELHHVKVDIVALTASSGGSVSSTQIRQLLQSGDVTGAIALLGRPHRIQGLVVQGAARGRTLGFPTANLEQVQEQLPAHGVYAGTSVIAGRKYPAAVHLGPNPTFAEGTPKLEVHLLDFKGDLYGQQLAVDLDTRIRDIVKFPSRDALLQQLHQDMTKVRQVVE